MDGWRTDRWLALGLAAAIALPARAEEPPKPNLEFAFELNVSQGADIKVADTAHGGRNIIPITGGTFEGPRIRGTILPGSDDWQLIRPGGCVEIQAAYILQTDDGAVIHVVDRGLAGCGPVRTTPTFEAPIGKYDWLSKSVFVGMLQSASSGAHRGIRVRFYRVR